MNFLLTFVLAFVSFLLLSLLSLLTIAFFTLFERKVMGLIHSRVGPSKVSLLGLIQPLLDAFKLLSKRSFYSLRSNVILYSLSPHFGLGISLLIWVSVPFVYSFFYSSFSLLYFIVLGSILVFAILVAGWSSNSKYSFIGRLRSVAQSISYEAVITTLVILLVTLLRRYHIFSVGHTFGILSLLLLPIWVFCTLAETHRAPFDFSESESELVSGFNTEYSGAYFAFIFLTEYGVLLVGCNIISYLFFGYLLSSLSVSFLPMALASRSLFMSFVFIWVRVTYVRYRYDLLISAAWKSLLPVSLFLLMLALIF
jgi:NADH-ubiquinone oxidoreductase chain 1